MIKIGSKVRIKKCKTIGEVVGYHGKFNTIEYEISWKNIENKAKRSKTTIGMLDEELEIIADKYSNTSSVKHGVFNVCGCEENYKYYDDRRMNSFPLFEQRLILGYGNNTIHKYNPIMNHRYVEIEDIHKNEGKIFLNEKT